MSLKIEQSGKVSTTQHTSCFTVSPLTQGPYGHWSSSVIKGIRSSESCVRNLCRSKTYNVSPTVDQKQPFTPVPYGPPFHRQTASAIYSTQPCWRMIPILYFGKYGPQLHQTFNHIFDSLSGQDNPFHLWQSCLNRSACVQSFKEHVGRQTFV